MANRCYQPLNDGMDTVCQNYVPDDGHSGCVLHRAILSHYEESRSSTSETSWAANINLWRVMDLEVND